MLTLYYKPTCFYSQAVLGEAENMNISFKLKDVTDVILLNELIDKGGKAQTPYLVDEGKSVGIYESKEIIDYLNENYSQGTAERTFGGLRVHQSDETCDTCQ